MMPGPYTYNGDYSFICPRDWNFYQSLANNCKNDSMIVGFRTRIGTNSDDYIRNTYIPQTVSISGTGRTITNQTEVLSKTINGYKVLYEDFSLTVGTTKAYQEVGVIDCSNKQVGLEVTSYDQNLDAASEVTNSFNCKD